MVFGAGSVMTVCPEWWDNADYGAKINAAIASVKAINGDVSLSKAGSFATTIELDLPTVHFNNHLLTYTGADGCYKK